MRPFGVFLFCFLFIYFFFGVGCWVFISVTLVSFFFLACSASPFGWVYTCLFQYIFGSLSCRGWFFFFTFEVFFVEFCRFFAFDPFCLCSPLGHWSVRHFGFLSPVATFSFHNVVEPVLLWCLLVFFSLILFSSVSVRPVRLRCVFVFTFFCALHRASTWSAEKKENQKKNKRKKNKWTSTRPRSLLFQSTCPWRVVFFCSKFIFYFWLLRCVRHFVSAEPLHFFFKKKKRIDLFGRI